MPSCWRAAAPMPRCIARSSPAPNKPMHWIERHWYQRTPVSVLLLPLAALYRTIVTLRRLCFRLRLLPSRRVSVPVIVVGNISVGGTGKTPLVVWLVQLLTAHNYRPGIVTRGYGGAATTWPQEVRRDSD